MHFGSIKQCSIIFISNINTSSLSRSTCRLVFKKNASDFSNSHPETHSFLFQTLMSFSILSMLSNSRVFFEAMVARLINNTIIEKIEEMQSTYSIKPLATWKVYTICKEIMKPRHKREMRTFPLNGWFDELTPRTAYCFRTVWKIFIFISKTNSFWVKYLTIKITIDPKFNKITTNLDLLNLLEFMWIFWTN